MVDRTQNRTLIRTYYPALNGLRGLAVLLVCCCHYGKLLPHHLLTDQMWVGVDLFFVLSGFLITGILFDSRESPLYYRTFYMRRALRIFPLYYGFFALLLLLKPILQLHYSRAVLWNLVYALNVKLLVAPNGQYATVHVGSVHAFRFIFEFGMLWSLCVEEHFYLVWPFVVRHLPSRKRLEVLCAAMVLGTPLLRSLLFARFTHFELKTAFLYWSTFSRWDSLFLGAFVALWLRGRAFSPRQVRRYALFMIVPSFAFLVAAMGSAGRRWPMEGPNPVMATFGYSLVALLCAGLLLLALDETSWLFRVLRTRAISNVGMLSYGLYIFHYPIYSVLAFPSNKVWITAHHLAPLSCILGFLLSYTLAWLSFHYYEAWFLRLKERKTRSVHHRSVPAAPQPSNC